MTNKSPEKLGRDPDAPTNVGPKIIHTRDELATLDPDTLLRGRYEGDDWHQHVYDMQYHDGTWRPDIEYAFPSVVIATGEHVRAARQALEATDDLWDLPSHRTEVGYPNCSTCDGGGCPDCTDPA